MATLLSFQCSRHFLRTRSYAFTFLPKKLCERNFYFASVPTVGKSHRFYLNLFTQKEFCLTPPACLPPAGISPASPPPAACRKLQYPLPGDQHPISGQRSPWVAVRERRPQAAVWHGCSGTVASSKAKVISGWCPAPLHVEWGWHLGAGHVEQHPVRRTPLPPPAGAVSLIRACSGKYFHFSVS